MRSLNLDQVRTVVAIADLGSFSKAAQALHLAQPTVSLHVRELEQRLGVALVLRRARGLELTPAGSLLVERGRGLLRDADDTLALLRAQVEGRSGRVRIGASPKRQKETTGAPVRSEPKLGKACACRPSSKAATESSSAAVTTPCPPRPWMRTSKVGLSPSIDST